MDRQAAFTLVELLTTLALLALLGALAVPALEGAILNARRAAALEELARAAWFARSEALRRGRPVLLCAAGPAGCDSSLDAWNGGWRVVPADTPGDPLRQGGGITDPRVRLLANRAVFRFEPHDRRSTNGTIAWCDRRGAAAARAIVIAPTGRLRMTRDAGSLACPAP